MYLHLFINHHMYLHLCRDTITGDQIWNDLAFLSSCYPPSSQKNERKKRKEKKERDDFQLANCLSQ
uniref:Uncharacterized protein n=1 Tax=Nelumbo nucifera TaxID=4432 RepID=A0A822Z9H5_NELNU|nr:TPA_asm: hypothetical protein HUJ06_016025 [Nelumbo nucifera]